MDDLFSQFQAEQDFYQQFLEEQRMSARGRASQDAQSRADFEEQAKKSLADPNITPQRRASLEKAIRSEGTEGVFDLAPTVGQGVKRFVGGVAQAIPATAMGALDLGLAALSPVSDAAKKGREHIAEAQAGLAELTGAKGIEGFAGNMVGMMGAGAVPGKAGQLLTAPTLPFAKAAEKTLQVASKVAPNLTNKALTGGKVARALGYTAADVPINLAQSLTIPDGTPEEQAKAFWIQMLASGVGATLTTPAPLPKGPRDIEVKPTGGPKQAPAEVAAKVQESLAKGDAKKAENQTKQKLTKDLKKQARIKWHQDNPGGDFTTLTSAQQQAVYKAFRDAQPKPVETPSEAPAAVEKVPPVGESSEAPVAVKDPVSPETRAELETEIASLESELQPLLKGYASSRIKAAENPAHNEAADAISGDINKLWAEIRWRKNLLEGRLPSDRLALPSGETVPVAKVERVVSDANLQPSPKKQKTLHPAQEGADAPGKIQQMAEPVPARVESVVETKPAEPTAKPAEPTGQGTVKTFYDRKDKTWKTQIIAANGEATGPAVPHDSKHKAVAFGSALAKEMNATLVQPRVKKTILDKETKKITDAEEAKVADLTGLRARVEEAKALAEAVSSDNPQQAFAAQKQYRALKAELAAAEAAQVAAPIPAPEPIPAQAPEAGTTTIPSEAPPTLTPEPAPTLPPREPGTYLESVPTDKPLERVDTVEELDDLIDAIDRVYDPETTPIGQYPESARTDIENIASRKRALQAQARIDTKGQPGDPFSNIVVAKAQPVERQLTPQERRKFMTTPVEKLTMEEVQLAYNDLSRRASVLSRRDPDSKPIFAQLDKLRSRLIQAGELPSENNIPGVKLNANPILNGAVVGFFTGAVYGDEPEDMLKYAALGGLAGYGAGKVPGLLRPKAKQSIVPKKILNNVKTGAELKDMEQASSFMEHARWLYTRSIRSAFGSERYTQGLNLDKAKDPGALAAMFGRWIAQAESWVAGKPFYETIQGEVVDLPAFGNYKGFEIRNAADIAKVVEGDTEGLGKLMAARTALEQYELTGKAPSGIKMDEAAALIQEMPEQYHVAADAARQLHLGLLEVLVHKGVLSREAASKMSAERFYAALERMYASPDKPIDQNFKQVVGSPNPVKRREGGGGAYIKNPFETMVSVIGRTMRSAEINHIKNTWVDLVESDPKAFNTVMRRVDSNTRGPDGQPLNEKVSGERVQQLKQELGLDTETAKQMIAAFSGDRLDPTNAVMTVYREGNLRTYRVNKFVAESMRALHPVEMNWMLEALAVPNKFARAGIVNNPVFIATQTLRDNWQMWMNSRYGFRPGIDWWIGLREVWKRGKNWDEYLKAGGGQTSFALRDVLSLEKSVAEAKAPGRTAWDGAVKRLKERSPAEAWHELVVPFAEAARMGEYLRARGAGASPIEAAYAAKHVGGNFQQNGLALRGLSMVSLFLNPSLQAMDQAVLSAGLHPFRKGDAGSGLRYAAKGIAGIAIPSALFWMANRGDDTIDELRKSETGRRYWFVRVSGNKGDPEGVIKIPKPIFEGQFFGTAMESMLDSWVEKDPNAVEGVIRAIGNDAAVNLLPTVGVVAASLWGNKDYRTGMPVTQGASEGLSPEYQVNPETSMTSRVIGQNLGPVSRWLNNTAGSDVLARALSPAGLDYLTRGLGGTLTHEAWRSLGQAYQFVKDDYMPVKEEWPIIRNALVNYPTAGAASLQQFYRDASKSERAAKDFAALIDRDPASAADYVLRNQRELMLADLYQKTRTDLADLRQQYQQLQLMKPGQFDPGFIRDMKKQMILAMIELARSTNEAANTVE